MTSETSEGGILRLPVGRGSEVKSLKSVVVGVLVAVVVFGGIQVVSGVTTNKQIKACAKKKSGVMRYTTKSCKKNERTLVFNSQGVPGIAGTKGDTGVAGVAGTTGLTGAAGTAGTNATVKITELSICGAGGTSLCKIGMQGPGGGIIFFVDYDDQYTGLNYLEAAPMGWGNGIPVNQGGLSGETTGDATVDPLMKWCSDTTTLLGLNGWDKSAVGAGASNTSTADITCAGGAIQAAADYVGGSKTDWFLPSIGEAMLMYTNLRPAGVGGFVNDSYKSSSESVAIQAWVQYFGAGDQSSESKGFLRSVRPARAF